MKSSRTKLQIGLWIGSIFMVIMIGLRYMPHEPDHPGFWEALYSTLRLFVFERDLPTFPHTPSLILIYFAAPLITASAIGAAVSYLFSISPMLRTRWISDHVIVCGVGQAGKIVIQTLKEKKVPVIGVDLGPAELFEEWRHTCKAAIVFGDFHLKQILDKVGISRARSVIFAAGDDLANLEGALAAYECMRSESGPVRLIWAHIANEKLAHTARLAMRTKGKTGIRFFDTYHIAAEKIIAKYFNRELRKNIREVNIIGFGKFGRDLFDVLIDDMGADENIAIRVIDKQNRKHSVESLAKEFGVSDRIGSSSFMPKFRNSN